MESIFKGNADIHFTAEGNGNPVVLIHGFASTFGVNWKNTGWFDYFLSLGRKVIGLDLRGHGESSKFHDPGSYLPERMGQDVLELMDHLAVETADLMGYSMGAWLSMYLLAAAPDRFGKGILGGVGDNFMTESGRGERIAQAMLTPAPKSITDTTLRMVRDFAAHTRSDLRALAACSRGVHQGLPPLDDISRPVLIVGGEKDDFVGPPDRIEAEIPRAAVRMMSGRDHLTLLTDKRFKEEVTNFLAADKGFDRPDTKP
jgi:pimeloyl-ACP methyl ester carboxylesterase